MFTPSPDYLQQLFAYLQAGQQLLQQWTALAGSPPPPANPFMPPAAPAAGQPMPATPFPALPAPTAPDYAQQLFSYLQAWRQYLEQAASPSPATSPTSPTAPALGGLLQTASTPHHVGGSDTPTPPPDDTGTKSNMIKDAGDGQKSKFPPEIVGVGPLFKSQTQVPDLDRERLQVLIPPFMKNGNMIDPLGQQIRGEDSVASSVQAAAPRQLSDRATPRAATAFQSAIDRVDRDSVQPMNAKTLFSPGFETSSG